MRDWRQHIARGLQEAGHEIDPSVREELSQHAAAAFAASRAEGAGPDEAATRVDALVAGWVAEGARLRHGRRAPLVEPPSRAGLRGVMHDVRYAWRLVTRRPGPAAVAALTMALGIGATTTLFSVVSGVLLKPLPWASPETLVRLEETREGGARRFTGVMTNAPYLAWANAPTTIDAIGAYSLRPATVTGAGAPQRLQVAAVTASLFAVLRAVPERGALFTAADEASGRSAVISHGLWQRQFGGAEDVLGRTILLDGTAYQVAGVLPRSFAFPDKETAAWIPFVVKPALTPDGGSSMQLFRGIARLAPGATPSQAGQEATARARNTDAGMAGLALFGTNAPSTITATPVLDAITGDVRDALFVLLVAVGLLLVTATANIAGVQLARAATRRREIAVRAALGAGGGRIARQLIVENLVIGALGGAAGLALTLLLHALLPSLLPADFPRVDDIRVDARVLAFSFAVTLASSLVCGLLPALQARRLDLRGGLAEDPAASGAGFRRTPTARLRALIMAGQVAAAVVLLVGASLMIRTFIAMLSSERGYDASNVLTARIATPDGLFTAERRAALVTRTLERLRAHPHVEHAGSTTVLPLLSGDSMMAMTVRATPGQPEQVLNTGFRVVSPGYFEAMGFRVREGRAFTAADHRTSMPALVVNRAFADKYLDGRATGRRLPASIYDSMPDWDIVGVVENVVMRGALGEPAAPEIFVSYAQVPGGLASQPIVVVRTRGDATALTQTLRQLVTAEEPLAALEAVMTMEGRVLGSLSRPRLYAVVLTAFAAFSLAIAGVGLFGLLSYSVTQRSRELGVRAALGAAPGQIVRLVLRDGMVITGVGMGVGLLLAFLGTRWMASFLFGVATHDPLTFLLVPGVLLVITLAASAFPAMRAARLDPLQVLRSS